MKRKTRIPQYHTDHDGRGIVLIPLANHPMPAKLFAEDYEWLRSRGMSDQWTFNPNSAGYGYVRCAVDGLQTVARLLVQAGPGIIVRYHDGDPLNLRTDNLKQWRGRASREAVLPKAGERTH